MNEIIGIVAGNMTPALLLTLLVGTPTFCSDWDKGVAAYKSGDYATALRE